MGSGTCILEFRKINEILIQIIEQILRFLVGRGGDTSGGGPGACPPEILKKCDSKLCVLELFFTIIIT